MRINVGDTWIELNELEGISTKSLHSFEREAVRFIQDWQNGKNSFTFHTSGSTGDPRPITFQREQLIASARLSIDALGLKAGATALMCLDPRFVAGAMMLVRCLLAGMDIVIRRPASNPFLSLKEDIDFVALVPLQVASILRETPAVLDTLSIVIIGGAPLPESTVAKLQQVRARCYATYGMTETLTHIALRQLNGPAKQDAFHALPGVRTTINDAGCLVIEATHLGGPVITHDLAEWVSDQSFRVLGRADEVINSGGVKVHPKKVEAIIENVVAELGYSFRFFIAGQPDDRLGEHVCLCIEAAPFSEAAESALLGHLNQWLSPYERPKEVIYCKSFKETATQKIDRRATLTHATHRK